MRQVSVREELVRERRRRGLSISKVAKDLGISYSYLHKIERGTRNPPLNLGRRISAYYGRPMEELFFSDSGDEMSKIKAMSS